MPFPVCSLCLVLGIPDVSPQRLLLQPCLPAAMPPCGDGDGLYPAETIISPNNPFLLEAALVTGLYHSNAEVTKTVNTTFSFYKLSKVGLCVSTEKASAGAHLSCSVITRGGVFRFAASPYCKSQVSFHSTTLTSSFFQVRRKLQVYDRRCKPSKQANEQTKPLSKGMREDGDGLGANSSCCIRMKAQVQIPSTDVESQARQCAPAITAQETGRFLEFAGQPTSPEKKKQTSGLERYPVLGDCGRW